MEVAANVGLIIFIAVVILNALGLTLDAILFLLKLPTVTSKVRVHPWYGVAILALQVVGLVALAMHFFLR